MDYQGIVDIVTALIPTISTVLTGICILLKVFGMLKENKEDSATQIKEFLSQCELKKIAEQEEQKKIISAQQKTIEMQSRNIEELTKQCRKIIDKVED